VNSKSEISTAREGNEGAQGKSPLERSRGAAGEQAQTLIRMDSMPRKDRVIRTKRKHDFNTYVGKRCKLL
jgi:hypothetical protein